VKNVNVCMVLKEKSLKKNQEKLMDSIGQHNKHFFLCSGKKSTEWSKKEDETDFIKNFTKDLKKAKNVKPRLTLIEDESVGEGFDILIFPDAIKVFGVTEKNYGDFIKEYFEDNKIKSLKTEKIEGIYIFICCHNEKSPKCGTCGPRLYKEFVVKLGSIEDDLKNIQKLNLKKYT